MEARDREFLEKMWSKAEVREESEKLAEAILSREKSMLLIRNEEPSNVPVKHGVFRAKASNKTDSAEPLSMTAFLKDMFRGIGIGQVYAGMADVLCISFAVTVCLLYLLTQGARSQGVSMDMAVFSGSPLLYGCIFLLFWMKDAQSDVYGLQMSCKYTFFHVLAARMLAASLLGMGCNGLYVLVLILRYQADGLRLGAISFSALACFSVLLMTGIEKGRHFGWAAAVCVGWVSVNLAAFFNFTYAYGELLGRIPVYLFLAVGAGAAILYFRQLLFMTTLTFRKEYTDASN